MPRCYLGLGSNLRTPKRQLKQAIKLLRNIPRTEIIKYSSIYASTPMGTRGQPIYANMVVEINTTLPALKILHYCQLIELQQKRIRKIHWGPRTLDIDILLYDNQSIKLHNLIIPHKQMLIRDFVLIPLREIAPNLQLPKFSLHSTGLSVRHGCRIKT